MEIVVNDQIRMSEFRLADRDVLVGHLNDRNIYERTLRIPFPYTEADADEWLGLVAKTCRRQWAIRSADDSLIGGFGFESFGHRSEIGYWLATPFWGRGIMTEVVRRMCRFAFEEMGFEKLAAHVFTYNPASARVLEKCGFEQEGYLRRHFRKDRRLIDVKLFALLKEAL